MNSRSRLVVAAFALGLLLVWFAVNRRMISANMDGAAGLALGLLFAAGILLRRKPARSRWAFPRGPIAAVAVVGAVSAVFGLVLGAGHLEWVGVLLVVFACLQWALPAGFSMDVARALAVLYVAWPLPSRLSGALQAGMQTISVAGAEWALHCVNVPAWADHMVLRLATLSVDVPAACSGMKTAMTVAVCCVGTGLLFRFAWYDILMLLAAGQVQVLAMNIGRIAITAVLAPGKPPEWVSGFLHNSLAVLLTAVVAAVELEAGFLYSLRSRRKRRAESVESGTMEHSDKASVYHPVWNRIFRLKWAILATMAFTAFASGAAYKRRDSHRAEMIRLIVEDTTRINLDAARRAALAAVALDGNNLDARLQIARVLILRREPGPAIEELDRIPPASRGLTHTVLKAQALADLERLDEALALIGALPAAMENVPIVAMVTAEIAARKDDADVVAKNVPVAATALRLLQRARRLFPYLSDRQRWEAIVRCDVAVPYDSLPLAAIAVDARFQVRDLYGMGRTLKPALATWPDEPVFLSYLLALAVAMPGSEWEELFADDLSKNLDSLNTDLLATYLYHCFTMKRPDLGWVAYRRLAALDPDDPSLYYTAASFADKWFTFRKHFLGLTAPQDLATLDLKPFLLQSRDIWPLHLVWDNVPLVKELCSPDAPGTAGVFLLKSIAEFEKRRAAGTASFRMEVGYFSALVTAGRYERAHALLDELQEKYPRRRQSLRSRRIALYDAQKEWQKSYEAVWECRSGCAHPFLPASVAELNALVHMNLGIEALVTAHRIKARFPASPQAAAALATVQQAFGFPEEALLTLEQVPGYENLPGAAAILFETGRFEEAKRVAKASGNMAVFRAVPEKQNLVLPPAEILCFPPLTAPLSDGEMAARARRFSDEADKAFSPFVRDLNLRLAEWHRKRGAKEASAPEDWRAVGRTCEEQATVLCELAFLLANERRFDEAQSAMALATGILPDSPIVWRVRLAVTPDKRTLMDEAVSACPSDPELWLANLVVKVAAGKDSTWVEAQIQSAVAKRMLPAGTAVRAGDFLLRSAMPGAAAVAARYAARRDDGFLPAAVLGLRCALALNDPGWAIMCSRTASRDALNPAPFDAALVGLKTATGKLDADLTAALEALRKKFPEDGEWSERLVQTYFQAGQMRTALAVLDPLLKGKKTELRVETLLIGAEAARIADSPDKAISMLETAYNAYPDNIGVLNNLVYTLSSGSNTLPRARNLLPALLAAAREDAAVYDTAAGVYAMSGDLQKAREYSDKALTLAAEKDHAVDEMWFNAAQISFGLQDYRTARIQLDKLLSLPNRRTVSESRIKQLSEAIERSQPDK